GGAGDSAGSGWDHAAIVPTLRPPLTAICNEHRLQRFCDQSARTQANFEPQLVISRAKARQTSLHACFLDHCIMCFLCDLKSASASESAARPSHVWSSRRAFMLAGAAAAASTSLPATAQVDVGKASSLRKLVPAEELEAAASQQYVQVMQEAQGKQVLLPRS